MPDLLSIVYHLVAPCDAHANDQRIMINMTPWLRLEHLRPELTIQHTVVYSDS